VRLVGFETLFAFGFALSALARTLDRCGAAFFFGLCVRFFVAMCIKIPIRTGARNKDTAYAEV
jgi:hypothetical protein